MKAVVLGSGGWGTALSQGLWDNGHETYLWCHNAAKAEEVARNEGERALCANACLVARALENHGRPVFDSGKALLAAMGVREIGALAGTWAAFDREENPSPEDGRERALALKKAWCTRLMSAFAGACSGRSEPSPQRSGPRK